MFQWFERLTEPFPSQDPQKPPATLFGFCRHYTRGFERPLCAMALLSAAVAVCEVTLLRYLGELVDLLSRAERATFWADQRPSLIVMAILVLAVMPLLAWLHSNLLHQSILGNYPMAIRWQVHRYLLGQSIAFFQRDFAGRVAAKVMQSAQSVREVVMRMVDLLIYILVYLLSVLVMIASVDALLLLPLLLWLAAYTLIQIRLLPRLRRIASEQANAQSVMSGTIVDTYTHITTVKLFSHDQRESDYARHAMQRYLATVYRQMRTLTGLLFSVDVINYLLLFSLAALSIALWQQQSVSVGVIAVGISLALRLQGMSKWIMWEVRALFESIGQVIDSIHTVANDIDVADKPGVVPLRLTHGEIRFNVVGFGYPGGRTLFDRLDLHIRPGEKVALVGRSGAGKSSLMHLLLRFYDLQSGSITLDAQNIAEVTQTSLRRQIGMITQDTALLHRSIRENLLYGNPQASEAEMIAACRRAEAHDFICQLADDTGQRGYDSQVGERGVKLSGGQRQRIAIARVLLKDAPILIMDEATSALDSEAEAAIQDNLAQMMAGKTVIAIAHRLSTIAAMDRLIVMDHGRIVAQGSHRELLRQNGIYAQLWAHQTGGFIGSD
ncbi:ABC transporter ATP-binding protein [Edwardsiella anguillarum]|uniref:ABC transporter ATP-binding protein n=1 Tax=Edwardsiella anguillarum TaxID=1821960 RepID=UPI0024B80669|nr:ABC transporter ATP-binding protein [Edwardsiella anguillarum]WHP80868.1 ABC transporter ATP-binding protein/permease [Edwardsiella anguillarum]WHQ18370.1 ABC transporter ATP-binding protein/permease [Edwardsiella anguillarum]WHQ21909.1 ABC transporter ATP-binding protein/permease [Edwardsiella anguillarum]WHQ25433.1 ABC transporter ATP-binding protein/permease [Edwardsiella anguillarum]WHQ28955.1 ABC transporter ATP-binding protein/permease [Edwardsiella anguillarum]